jgi:hypothetical protein
LPSWFFAHVDEKNRSLCARIRRTLWNSVSRSDQRKASKDSPVIAAGKLVAPCAVVLLVFLQIAERFKDRLSRIWGFRRRLSSPPLAADALQRSPTMRAAA